MRSTRSLSSIEPPRWLSRVLGFDPVPPPPHVFALDPTELRYGALHRGPQGLVFAAAASRAVPSDVFEDGPLGAPVRDPAALTTVVAELVGEIPQPLKSATLVLPDAWLRLTFVELDELPRRSHERDEVLRWKLKRLLPFRVEDLRVAVTAVRPLPGQAEAHRLLVGFALEPLVAAIEDAFARTGVEIGRVVSSSVALAAAVEARTPAGELGALVAVFPDAYTLTVFGDGEPVLYRYKAQPAEAPAEALAHAARRDLRLTASYLAESLPGHRLGQVLLAAPGELEEAWLAMLGDELGVPAAALGFEHLGLARLQPGVARLETAPLAGAARLEVAAA